MKASNISATGMDISQLQQTPDGSVDYDFYMARGRRLQGKVVGDMFHQAGRHLISLLHLAK